MLHGKQALKTFLFNPQIPKIRTNGQGYVPLVMVFVSRTVTNTNSRPGSGLSTCARCATSVDMNLLLLQEWTRWSWRLATCASCATSVDMNLLLLLLQEWSRWSRWLATSASCATSSTTTRWWRASRTARRRLTSTSTLYACLFSALPCCVGPLPLLYRRTVLSQIDWLSCGFTSHWTQNRSFRRRVPMPFSWLGTEETKLNTTKARTHQSEEMYTHMPV